MDGVLGVIWWDTEDGRHYRCQGSGSKYRRFYQWVKQTSYRCTGEDFPWDFFVFDDLDDHDLLVKEFPGDVWEDSQ